MLLNTFSSHSKYVFTSVLLQHDYNLLFAQVYLLLSFLCKVTLNFEKLCIPLLSGPSSLPTEEKLEQVFQKIRMLRMEGE